MGRKNKAKLVKSASVSLPTSSDESRSSPDGVELDVTEKESIILNENSKMNYVSLLEKSNPEANPERISSLISTLERRTAELDCAKKLIASLKKDDVDQLKKTVDEAENEILDLTEKLNVLEMAKHRSLNEIRELKERLIQSNESVRSIDKLSKENAKISEEFKKAKEAIDKANLEIKQLEEKQEKTNKLLEESQNSMEKEKRTYLKAIEEEKLLVLQAHNQVKESQQVAENHRLTNLNLQNELSQLKCEVLKFEDSKVTYENEVAFLLSEKANAELTIAKLTDKLSKTDSLLEQERSSKNIFETKMTEIVEQKILEVEQLRKNVDQFKIEIETTKQHNEKLTEMCRNLGTERDEAIQVSQVIQKKIQLLTEENQSIRSNMESNNNAQNIVEELQKKLDRSEQVEKEKEEILKNVEESLKRSVKECETLTKKEAELNEKILQLKSEAKKKGDAEKKSYKKHQKEKKMLEESLEKMNEELKTLKEDLNSSNSKIEQLEKTLKREKEESDDLKKRLKAENEQQFGELIRKKDEEIRSLKETMEKKETDFNNLASLQVSQTETLKLKDRENVELKEKMDNFQFTLKELEKMKISFNKLTEDEKMAALKASTLETRIIELQRSCDNQQKRYESELSNLRTKVKELLEEKEVFQNNLKHIETYKESAEKKNIELIDNAKVLKSKIEQLVQENEKLILLANAKDENEKAFANTEKKLQELLDVANKKLESSENEINKLKVECKRLREDDKLKKEQNQKLSDESKIIEQKLAISLKQIEYFENKTNELEAERKKLYDQLEVSHQTYSEEEIKKLANELDHVGKQLEEAVMNCGDYKRKLEDLEKSTNLEKKKLKKDLVQLRKELEESIRKEEEQEVEIRRLNELAEKKKEVLESISEQENQVLKEKLIGMDERLKVLDAVAADMEKIIDEYNSLKNENEEMKQEIERLREVKEASDKLLEGIKNAEQQLVEFQKEREENEKSFKEKLINMEELLQDAKLEKEKVEENNKVLEKNLAATEKRLIEAEQILIEQKEKSEKISRFETRMEELQRSAQNMQKRYEEELLKARNKLEEVKQIENQKILSLTTEIQTLQGSLEDSNKKLETAIRTTEQNLQGFEEERKKNETIINDLKSKLSEDKKLWIEEKKQLEVQTETLLKQLAEKDSLIQDVENKKLKVNQLEKQVLKLQESQKVQQSPSLDSAVVEKNIKNGDSIVNFNNDGSEIDLKDDESITESFNFSKVWYRRMIRRIQLLERQSPFAIYPYIRYIFVAYMIILHLVLLW